MDILHIITGMQKAAGTTVFVENVANELRKLGHVAEVVTTASPWPQSATFDVVHIHGLWSPFLHQAAKWARRRNVPIVWSPHGMLTPWALKNKWMKKFAALALYQWRDLHSAAAIHATADSEVEDIRRLLLGNRIVEAPLGICLPEIMGTKRCSGKRTLLFVSRVQRKKGLPNLVSAWAQLPGEFRADWQVRIVGPDQDGHTAELKKQCAKLGVEDDFAFVGPKFDSDLAAEYAAADLFVLPTHSENFGSVVLEALAYGVPVICTKGAPWAELESERCGRWIEQGVEPLRAALAELMALSDEERVEMGARGRALAAAKYQWPAVAKKLLDCYAEVVG